MTAATVEPASPSAIAQMAQDTENDVQLAAHWLAIEVHPRGLSMLRPMWTLGVVVHSDSGSIWTLFIVVFTLIQLPLSSRVISGAGIWVGIKERDGACSLDSDHANGNTTLYGLTMCKLWHEYDRCRGWQDFDCPDRRPVREREERCWEVIRRFLHFGACGIEDHREKPVGTYQCLKCEMDQRAWKEFQARWAWKDRWGLLPKDD